MTIRDDDIRAATFAVSDRMQAGRWIQYYAVREAYRAVLELQERHPRSAELRIAANRLSEMSDDVLDRIHQARRAKEAA